MGKVNSAPTSQVHGKQEIMKSEHSHVQNWFIYTPTSSLQLEETLGGRPREKNKNMGVMDQQPAHLSLTSLLLSLTAEVKVISALWSSMKMENHSTGQLCQNLANPCFIPHLLCHNRVQLLQTLYFLSSSQI